MKEMWKSDKKFRIKVIAAGAVLLVLLCACIYTLFIKPGLNTETYVYKEEEVSRGDLILGIMESGSLSMGESAVTYDLDISLDEDDSEEDSSDDESESDSEEDSDEEDEEESVRYLEIEEIYVVSGQRIKQGDALFRLSDDSVKAVRRKLSAALAEAQIAYSEAQTEYNISILSAKSTYDSSVTTGNRAEATYQAARNRSAANVAEVEGSIKVLELEIQNAQEMLADEDFLISITEAQTAYTQAKNKYEETDVHNATAYISNLTAYQQAEETLEQLLSQKQEYEDIIAENQQELSEKQTEIEKAKTSQVLEDEEAKSDYGSALLEGELAGEIYEYSTSSLSDEVTKAENEFSEIQTQMDAFEAFVGSDNTVYAPEDGLVLGVNYEAEDKLTQTGDILTYSKESDYTVSIDVSEEDIAAISVGSPVTIVFSAYPDETYTGTIISITTTATTEYAATISYPVVIAVEGDTEKLYGGMSADVTFVTDSVSDVLYVSKKAVFEEDGKKYVYRKAKNGKMEQVQVETGFEDMSSVEIKSGLEEGDIVYLKSIMNTNELEDDSQNREQSEGDTESTQQENQGMPGDFEMPAGGLSDGEMPEAPDGEGQNGGGFPGNMGGGNS